MMVAFSFCEILPDTRKLYRVSDEKSKSTMNQEFSTVIYSALCANLDYAAKFGIQPPVLPDGKPFIPSAVNLSEIPVPAAEMRVKNVCLYRSDHLENGMAYTVIGRGKAAGEQRGTVHAGGSHDAI